VEIQNPPARVLESVDQRSKVRSLATAPMGFLREKRAGALELNQTGAVKNEQRSRALANTRPTNTTESDLGDALMLVGAHTSAQEKPAVQKNDEGMGSRDRIKTATGTRNPGGVLLARMKNQQRKSTLKTESGQPKRTKVKCTN
jgi:hypothetical protein